MATKTPAEEMREAFEETEGLDDDEVNALVDTGSVTIEREVANPAYDDTDEDSTEEESITVTYVLTLTVAKGG